MRWKRIAAISAIAGLAGGALVLLAWRLFARSLLAVAPAAGDVPSCSRTAPDPRFSNAVHEARPQVLAMLREKRVPGLAVAVALDGRVVWSEAFGHADRELGAPACPDTRFRIGSVSKPITAVAMAKLAEEGKLDLDAPIQRYVPTFPDKGHVITARQLASHRAGIRHYRDDMEAFTTRQFRNLREALQLFERDSLLFAPGTDHVYSSYGYLLLGAAIEGASGREFGEYLEEQVARPLGLTRTTVDRNDSTLAGVTRFYDHVTPYVMDGQVRRSPFVAMSSKWAGGGILSTAEDLVRFGSSLLPGARQSLLRDETRAMLFEPLTRATPPIFGYALGWMTMRDADLRRVYMHFGAGSGSTAWIGVYPDDRMAVAVLANLGHAGLGYAQTLGIGARFVRPRISAFLLAFAVGFFAFAGGTGGVLALVRLVRRRNSPHSVASI